MEIKRCTRCILPDFYPRINYDSDGVCNYCKEDSKKKPIDWNSRRNELEKMISEAKSRKLPYDVLVPWSGGKDSTYVIYYLKKVQLQNIGCQFS
jgi:3'-phosphoadenosine 5'-phosphosulfate sulfotransferase (PAPS reductase)/FAD synthetase